MEEQITLKYTKSESKCDTVSQESEAEKRLASTTGQRSKTYLKSTIIYLNKSFGIASQSADLNTVNNLWVNLTNFAHAERPKSITLKQEQKID